MERISIELLTTIVLICFLVMLAVIAVEGILKEQDRKAIERQTKHDEWLFNQLYSIAPGKVLKPDEVEEKIESKPAHVIHMNRDPMNEFKGKKDDWRE